MIPLSTAGYEKPTSVSAGPSPLLQWLKISDLVVDPTYQRPIVGKGRHNVNHIASAFSWSCFSPVVVSPIKVGKFAIIDGQHRTTAAALAGFEMVPCQIVVATREQQAAAFKAINGSSTPISRMALQAAAVVANEPAAMRIADVCARAEVRLLRYPVPVDKQKPGETMAVGAITRCLKQYGEEALITALQCVTQTDNNVAGALSARTIKALCEVLHNNLVWRDSGLALLEAFDAINLCELQTASVVDAAVKRVSRTQALADRIRSELRRLLPSEAAVGRAGAANTPLAKSNGFEMPGKRPSPHDGALTALTPG